MEISLQNRQKTVKLPVRALRKLAKAAVAEVLGVAKKGAPLKELEEIDIAIVDDETIASVHVEFMDIEGATDVITFDYGEIVISAETAESYAKDYGNASKEEVSRYIVHGLLHLAGYDDRTQTDYDEMKEVQERILVKCLNKIPELL